jgi:tRNA pseudouridine55 synthase
MKRSDRAVGLLLVDKPEGPTSHDVVQQVRQAFCVRRIGHTGTLDPFASGLLLLCVGPATRLTEYFHRLPKRYEARVTLGTRMDTDDHTGRVVSRSAGWKHSRNSCRPITRRRRSGEGAPMRPPGPESG